MENTNDNEVVSSEVGGGEKKGGKRNLILIIIIAIIIIGVGAYLIFGKEKISGLLVKAESVATVNGVDILKKSYDLQYANTLATYKAQGVDVGTDPAKLAEVKKQVLDNLINSELLLQGAKTAGIKSDPVEEEKQFQAILTQIGGADKLKVELEKNNVTEAEVKEDIQKQFIIQSYLSKNIDTSSVVVTDAEIKLAYDQFVKIQKDSGQKTIPTLKELSPEIKQYITSNKQQALVSNFISTLKAKADIKTSI
ncbi:MAG: SurA N-terminal domain-containing protein [bacterium]|nr:SurA N-terminal domain-containing protein [bacterium]